MSANSALISYSDIKLCNYVLYAVNAHKVKKYSSLSTQVRGHVLMHRHLIYIYIDHLLAILIH